MKMDMKDMMLKAKDMQEAMAARQKELASRTFEANAGGGMVTATVSGKPELLRVKIDQSIVSAEDVGMLEDLIVAAVNEAYKRAGDAIREEMSGMVGLGALKNLFT